MPLEKALRLAQDSDLDLVEVAPQARPPVCKLMDYGKFKYESAMKAREARKKTAHTIIKEMKLRPKIDPHDYQTKRGHVERFLKAGDKVKITIMFRGREQHRPELGLRLLARLASEVEELGFVESSPKQDGRNMIMVLGPHRKKTEANAERDAAKAARRAEDDARITSRRTRPGDDGDSGAEDQYADDEQYTEDEYAPEGDEETEGAETAVSEDSPAVSTPAEPVAAKS